MSNRWPPGWYPIATEPGVEGWWDGARWSDARRRQSEDPPAPSAPGRSDARSGGLPVLAWVLSGVASLVVWVAVLNVPLTSGVASFTVLGTMVNGATPADIFGWVVTVVLLAWAAASFFLAFAARRR